MALTPYQRWLVAAERRHVPVDVGLELTHHCNYRCQHCYIPNFQAPDMLTTERILRLLDELAEIGTLRIALTGGEMFLRRDWLPIARRARELGFELRLFSNASLITDAVADAIVPLHATVEISMYSMDEAVFERITQKPGSFARTIAGIEALRRRDVRVLLKMPLMIHNYTGVGAVYEYAASVGAECRSDHVINAKKDGDRSTIALRVPEKQLLPYYGGPYSGCASPSECDPDSKGDGPLCAAGVRYANVTASGDVQACNILPGSAGNIRERSFREVWEGSPWLAKIRAIRRSDLPVCSTCPKISYCNRCHAQALVEDGDILGPSSWACNHAAALEEVERSRKGA